MDRKSIVFPGKENRVTAGPDCTKHTTGGTLTTGGEFENPLCLTVATPHLCADAKPGNMVA